LGCRPSEVLALIEIGQIKCVNFDTESELFRIDQASVDTFAEKIGLEREEEEKRERRRRAAQRE
jgi:hypothetical protein